MQNKLEKVRTDMVKLAAPYLNDPAKAFEEAYNRGERTVYCRGGIGIHRGFYCPSPIDDIITGNVGRGTLCNKLPTKYAPDYAYRIDATGQLCTVCQYGIYKEYIVRDNEFELGLLYRVDEMRPESVDTITLSSYQDNRIQLYAIGDYDDKSNTVYHCILEAFA